jgi:hypothetical protein
MESQRNQTNGPVNTEPRSRAFATGGMNSVHFTLSLTATESNKWSPALLWSCRRDKPIGGNRSKNKLIHIYTQNGFFIRF